MSATPAVVIAAGGTGGHIYPAIAVARVLESRKVPVVWIGTREGLESHIVPAANIDIRFINVSGLRGTGLKGMITGPFKVLLACVQSMRILSDVRANAVLGMGGFVSGPVGIAALLTRRVLVLHEQNAVAGMTNKWLGRLATRVYSAMPNVFPKQVGATAIGNPVRASIEALGIEKRGRVVQAGTEKTAAQNDTSSAVDSSAEAASLKVLIIGGSRGARVLNEVVPGAMQQLTRLKPELNLQVWHQTGPNDEQAVRQSYAETETDNAMSSLATSAKVDAYIDEVTDAYAWADVIICRAGAMTVSELSAAALPGILIPFPHHVDDHQTRNAEFLTDAGAAVLMPQPDMNANSLAEKLEQLIASPEILSNMSVAAQALHKPDAATVVADALQEARN